MVYLDRVDSVIDEMSIVDIFTKLIFDAQSPLSSSEERVIAALGDLMPSLSNVSRNELSEYLRAMSVDEMIRAVEQIKLNTIQVQEFIATKPLDRGHHLSP